MGFASILLEWFRENGRDLPWRQTRDPYAIWLSEIILQQTQVKQGWEYWERFMHHWPTVEALAKATEDEVLREWQGLGYYSRARNLHYAAKQIVALGHFPDTLAEIKQLKGVGDYTAAAIGSTPINTTEGKKTFAAMAQELLPPKEASAYNQAIMDFGAIQCTPQSPHCDSCPLMESCIAFRERRVAQLPVKLKTLKVTERHLIYIYIRCQGQTAIRRRGPGDIWQGLWEPVLVDAESAVPPTAKLLCHHVKHVLTHRVLYADFYLLETDVRPELPSDYIWISESDLDNYALPRLIEVLLSFLPK